MSIRTTIAVTVLTAVELATAVTATAGSRPVVVELFTSQGCNSCPPANANFIGIMDRQNVLALSFAVTYWDRLGWKDIFGKPEFTARQYAYEPALGESGPFTPQIVVDGRVSAVGMRRGEIESLIAAAGEPSSVAVDLSRDRVSIDAGAAPAGGADVWLVRYQPGVLEVSVARGENAGRKLPHGHVVRDLVRLGGWTGAKTAFPITPVDRLKTAVLVQAVNGGPILGAAAE
ncbi:DUF1223 domain-containing protein [Pinisolibacter sp.]|uniref:DUF1223 domain-containing protein n=1 Tax=Pinisolibacter sp. TaxID=2172024 RepID=UPI002FDEB6C9